MSTQQQLHGGSYGTARQQNLDIAMGDELTTAQNNWKPHGVAKRHKSHRTNCSTATASNATRRRTNNSTTYGALADAPRGKHLLRTVPLSVVDFLPRKISAECNRRKRSLDGGVYLVHPTCQPAGLCCSRCRHTQYHQAGK